MAININKDNNGKKIDKTRNFKSNLDYAHGTGWSWFFSKCS